MVEEGRGMVEKRVGRVERGWEGWDGGGPGTRCGTSGGNVACAPLGAARCRGSGGPWCFAAAAACQSSQLGRRGCFSAAAWGSTKAPMCERGLGVHIPSVGVKGTGEGGGDDATVSADSGWTAGGAGSGGRTVIEHLSGLFRPRLDGELTGERRVTVSHRPPGDARRALMRRGVRGETVPHCLVFRGRVRAHRSIRKRRKSMGARSRSTPRSIKYCETERTWIHRWSQSRKRASNARTDPLRARFASKRSLIWRRPRRTRVEAFPRLSSAAAGRRSALSRARDPSPSVRPQAATSSRGFHFRADRRRRAQSTAFAHRASPHASPPAAASLSERSEASTPSLLLAPRPVAAMPKSRRDKVVALTQTKKKDREWKGGLIESVREALDEYSGVFVFRCVNLRNNTFKDMKADLKDTSKFFMGSNKVLQVALGKGPEDEQRDGLHQLPLTSGATPASSSPTSPRRICKPRLTSTRSMTTPEPELWRRRPSPSRRDPCTACTAA